MNICRTAMVGGSNESPQVALSIPQTHNRGKQTNCSRCKAKFVCFKIQWVFKRIFQIFNGDLREVFKY